MRAVTNCRIVWGRPGRLLSPLGVLWVLGCGGSAEPASAPGANGEPTRRDTTIVHEPCDIESGSVSKGDANGDGRPDVITVAEGGKPTCQWLDLNFDRVVDVWVYYGSDGSVRRRETDFDRDGRIDELTTLERGSIVTRERATNLAGRLDTWQYFRNGVLERGERDANGDGVIDQWWEYPKGDQPRCALVHSDTNGDGRPDPGATVDLCAMEDTAANGESEDGDAPNFDAPLTESTAPAPGVAPPNGQAGETPGQTPEGAPPAAPSPPEEPEKKQ